MKVLVNGESRAVPVGQTLAALLAELGLAGTSGIAIAVNATVISRTVFATHTIGDGDEIEIIRAVAGG